MDLMKLGTQLILSKLGQSSGETPSESGITSALSGLLGGGSDGGIDFSSLLANATGQGGGLGDILGSWLGDGDNEAISGNQIKDMLGGDKIAEFASNLGIDEDSAADSLAEAVPQMVDNGSSGGSLLDSVGGVAGAIGLAKKFFS